MKRLLLVTTLIAVLATICAVPYWFGVEAERIFHRQMDLLDANNKVDVIDTRFQRGWFSSDAETEFRMPRFQATVLAQHSVDHGPIPVSDPLRYLTSLSPLQALIRSQLSVAVQGKTVPVGSLRTSVNMDSSTHTRIIIPATELQLEPSGELAWQQISGRVDFQPGKAAWQGELSSSGADWGESGTIVRIGPFKLTFTSYPGRTSLALGNSSLTAESLQVRLPESEDPVTTSSLTINSSAEEQNENVTYSLDGDFAAANFRGLGIESGEWRLQAKNLDRDTLTRLHALDTDAALPLNDLIGLVIKRSAELESFIRLTTESGPFTADAKVTLSNDGSSTSPLMVLSALRGRLNLEMPAAMAELAAMETLQREQHSLAADGDATSVGDEQQRTAMNEAVPAKIQSWVDDNLLTRYGDRYRFQATIANGAVEINGQPFDFMSLLR